MSSGEFAEKLEGFVAEAMQRDHVLGLSLAVVKDGHVIYARGFGARRLKDNAPATPDTLYGVGSCTKSFTALAIMQLVQQGKLEIIHPKIMPPLRHTMRLINRKQGNLDAFKQRASPS